MLWALSTAATGLHAASARLAATAGNIANLDSAGYQARRANLTATPGGVAVDTYTRSSAAGTVDPDGVETSNVDLARESVNLIRDRHLYSANAKMVKAADRMLGTLLDVLAE